jgi:hypothetical protein
MVEEGARDASLRWLDLGLGDEPYKNRFANNTRETRYVHLSRGFQRHLVSRARQMLTTTAERFPQFGNRLREARDFFQTAAGRVHETGAVATVRYSIQRAVRPLASQDEVLLFEAPDLHLSELQPPENQTIQLLPLTREHLVEASISNAGDPHTLRYLMRCANRLTKQGTSGFLVQDETGRPIHFLWIDSYAGFRLAEIDHNLEPSCPNAAMIFDCWTPAADRGRGHYTTAIRLAAAKLRRENRPAWIFSSAKNVPSLRGILKAGFAYRFSLIRRRRLGRATITRHETTTAI